MFFLTSSAGLSVDTNSPNLAMQRASEVQEKRAELHYVNRMAAHKVKAAVRARVEIKQGVDLIEASVAQKEVVSVDKMETQKQQVQI